VQGLRARLKRALMSMLLLSQGTPMLSAGDELGHTQGGNNNPYCQDSETTWIDWANADQALIDFTGGLIHIRRALMPLGGDWNDHLDWLRPDGQTMQSGDWNDASRQALACLVSHPERSDKPLLLLINGGGQNATFTLRAGSWTCLMDSGTAFTATTQASGQAPASINAYELGGRSMALLALIPGAQPS
jgi:pullulanase/glycogen debranching enzyme